MSCQSLTFPQIMIIGLCLSFLWTATKIGTPSSTSGVQVSLGLHFLMLCGFVTWVLL